MNKLTKIGCRIYQKALFVAQIFLPIKEPKVISGDSALNELAEEIQKNSHERVLIITQMPLLAIDEVQNFIRILSEKSIQYEIFKDTLSNPTIEQIETVKDLYLSFQAQALIALGGGSAIDLAKGVGARIARPDKSITQMKGILKVGKKIPTLYAIPTTSGTGSEATLACVVTDSSTSEKYAINDPVLIPKYAVLDPRLLIGLPKDLTATTGMDALTHAIEAFIGKSNTKKTKANAVDAIHLIFDNLLLSYTEPSNLVYRSNMQLAAYKAGLAFTKAYVGNVHAIAHTLGGMYHIPHGLANAVILPHVLEFYNHKINSSLVKLAKITNIGSNQMTNHDRSQLFIEKIKSMNQVMSIPQSFDEIIKEKDLDLLISRAMKEANPLYPVPVIMDKKAFLRIYTLIQD